MDKYYMHPFLCLILQSEFNTATRYFAPRGDCFPAVDCY